MSRTIHVLNGDGWLLGQAPAGADPQQAAWSEMERVGDWLPATVPGNVRADLERAGRLPDLHRADGPEAAQWVDEHCWWLVRDWTLPLAPGRRLHLVLRGVDYIADLFLNGTWLGRHEGMFSPQVHDVTHLHRDQNRLAVRLLGSRWLPRDRSGPLEKALNLVENRVTSLASRFPQRRDTLKCQMGFGWDFAPPLLTMGLWDDVYLLVTGAAAIRDVAVRPSGCLAGGEATVTVDVELDAAAAAPLALACSLQGETFAGEPLHAEQELAVRPGTHHARLTLAVPRPRLWWPWDQGEPDLYRLTVAVRDRSTGQVLDAVDQVVGLRQVEMDGWTLRINGRRVFARGANWVPADILPGRTGEDDYRALLTLARQANMNMLRVWGGGLREKRPFYDLCDRMGLLVWQEFPLACAFLTRFPRSPGYVQLVRDEVRAIVRDVRNHPCLVAWCGGNEFDPKRNRPVVEAMRQVVAEEDGSRPFLPASPAGGDSHYWRVWHNLEPASAYREDRSLFASEFGLQAPPSVPALRRFLPEEALWPPGRLWELHGAGLDKLWRYARPFLAAAAAEQGEAALAAFVAASQRAQAHGLQIAIEHYRRARARGGGGALVWQLNEPWPAISWAIVGFDREPKPAYEVVRRALSPLLVSLDYPLRPYRAGDRLEMDVWLINDTASSLPAAEIEVVLHDEVGTELEHALLTVDVAPDSAAPLPGRLRWTLPPGERWRLAWRLIHAGQVVSANEYELGPHDDIGPTLGQRLWARLGRLVIPAVL